MPDSRLRRAAPIALAALIVVLLVAAGMLGWRLLGPRASVAETPTPTPLPTGTAVPVPSLSPSPPPPFDTSAHSIDDPSSIWVVVDKLRQLDPKDYTPPDLVRVPLPSITKNDLLRKEAADALGDLADAFTADTGEKMQSQSAYRSFAEQTGVYNGWVSSLGQAGADKTSARPGFSEHQTGWAVDIAAVPAQCGLDQCFADTTVGKWVAKNAWEYGFIIRYPEGETATTGYEYEPWHLRYVGVDLATEMHERGIVNLEDVFELPPAPDYAG